MFRRGHNNLNTNRTREPTTNCRSALIGSAATYRASRQPGHRLALLVQINRLHPLSRTLTSQVHIRCDSISYLFNHTSRCAATAFVPVPRRLARASATAGSDAEMAAALEVSVVHTALDCLCRICCPLYCVQQYGVYPHPLVDLCRPSDCLTMASNLPP